MNDPTSHSSDPYALPPDAIQEPPHSLLQGAPADRAGADPGRRRSSAPGELINTTGLGAKQGFILLWLILLSCVIKVFVQVELGRYAITHGKTTLAAFDTLPGPRLGTSWMCWLWLFMMLATQAQIAAMEGTGRPGRAHGLPGGLARGGADVAGGSIPAGARSSTATRSTSGRALTALAAIALLLSGGYKRLEQMTTVLVAAGDAVHRRQRGWACQWTEFRISLAEPRAGLRLSPSRPTAVALAFSAFGITGVGASELFAYPYWCIEKGYARVRRPAVRRRGLGPPRPGLARGSCSSTPGSAWSSSPWRRSRSTCSARPCSIPRGSTRKGPEMIPTLSRCTPPLQGTALRLRLDPRRSSCSGPGPSCSRPSTSPPPPTAA